MNHNPLHIEERTITINRKVILKIKLKLKYQLKEFNLTLGTQRSINLK